MGFKITIDRNFSGEHMGLVFSQGTAHTEDAFLASRLQSKGYKVTPDESDGGKAVSASDEIAEGQEGFTPFDLERMTIQQLKEYAEAGDIDLGGARTKAEIVAAIYADHAETEQ